MPNKKRYDNIAQQLATMTSTGILTGWQHWTNARGFRWELKGASWYLYDLSTREVEIWISGITTGRRWMP